MVIGDSDKLVVGEKLISISSPKGIKNIIDECLFSGFKFLSNGNIFSNYVCLSESIMNSGSSGGAIFNMKGELIAINQGGHTLENIDNAIPINDIKPLLERHISEASNTKG